MSTWLVQTLAVAAGLALLAAVAGRVGRLGPRVRHALWLLVLLKLMTPPLVVVTWPDATPEPIDAPAVALAEPMPEPEPEPAPAPAPIDRPAEPAPGLAGEEPGDLIVPEVALGSPLTTLPPAGAPQFLEPIAPPVAALPSPLTSSSDHASDPEAQGPVDPIPGELGEEPAGEAIASWADWLIRAGLGAWLAGSIVVAGRQGYRLLRFQRRLAAETHKNILGDVPDWLMEELGDAASRLGVRVPRVIRTELVDTPLVWCLGRPRLLLPDALVDGLDRDAWRGVIRHELAHLRRGDHWVARLDLLAEVAWWWNPLFWLARVQIHKYAELCCDARVVAMESDASGRHAYAMALLSVCEHMSKPRPTPTLGLTLALGLGVGESEFPGSRSARTLERRLRMILEEPPAGRPSRLALPLILLLGLVAVPIWLHERDRALIREIALLTATLRPSPPPAVTPALLEIDAPGDPVPAELVTNAVFPVTEQKAEALPVPATSSSPSPSLPIASSPEDSAFQARTRFETPTNLVLRQQPLRTMIRTLSRETGITFALDPRYKEDYEASVQFSGYGRPVKVALGKLLDGLDLTAVQDESGIVMVTAKRPSPAAPPSGPTPLPPPAQASPPPLVSRAVAPLSPPIQPTPVANPARPDPAALDLPDPDRSAAKVPSEPELAPSDSDAPAAPSVVLPRSTVPVEPDAPIAAADEPSPLLPARPARGRSRPAQPGGLPSEEDVPAPARRSTLDLAPKAMPPSLDAESREILVIQIRRSKAVLTRATAQKELAEATLTRLLRTLEKDRNLVSTDERNRGEAELKSANANVQISESEVAEAEARLKEFDRRRERDLARLRLALSYAKQALDVAKAQRDRGIIPDSEFRKAKRDVEELELQLKFDFPQESEKVVPLPEPIGPK